MLSNYHHPPLPPEGHHSPPPPPDHWRRWETPFPTENDCILMCKLLGDEDLGQSMFRIFKSSPSEIGAIAVLILRLFEQQINGTSITQKEKYDVENK